MNPGVQIPKMFKMTLSGGRKQLRNFFAAIIKVNVQTLRVDFKRKEVSFVKSSKFILHVVVFN